MSLRRFFTDAREASRRRDEWYRTQGFTDGKAGRPARSVEATYQRAYREGLTARSRDLLLNDLDDAS